MTQIKGSIPQAIEAIEGLSHGADWNNGTHAKIYRPKLLEALAGLRAYKDALPKACLETGLKNVARPSYESEQREWALWCGEEEHANAVFNAAKLTAEAISDD